MSTILLPRFDRTPATSAEIIDHHRAFMRLVRGEYQGCTVFRAVDGKIQVGKLVGLVHVLRATYTKQIEVKRYGRIEGWDLNSGVWVCV